MCGETLPENKTSDFYSLYRTCTHVDLSKDQMLQEQDRTDNLFKYKTELDIRSFSIHVQLLRNREYFWLSQLMLWYKQSFTVLLKLRDITLINGKYIKHLNMLTTSNSTCILNGSCYRKSLFYLSSSWEKANIC